MPETEDTCDNCGEIELVSGTFVSDSGDLITSGKFCTICEMFESTDNFIHEDFEKQYAKREELVEKVKELRFALESWIQIATTMIRDCVEPKGLPKLHPPTDTIDIINELDEILHTHGLEE